MKKLFLLLLTIGVGMKMTAIEQTNGVYQIGSVADLNDFANLVNGGNNGANAVLTADIDNYSGPMIGSAEIMYSGTFDGQYHKITYSTEPTEPIWSLFRTLTGTIRNLNVAGTITTSQKQVGGLVGFIYGGIVENCICSVDIITSFRGDAGTGGFAATSMTTGSTFRNCIFNGKIQGASANSCGGILGWVTNDGSADLTNCMNIGEIIVGSAGGNVLVRNPGRATITNCYYLNAYGSVSDGVIQITEEQLKSGEVCYLLSSAFRQNIGYDVIPTLDPTHGIVNKIGATGYATQYIADSNVLVPEGVTAYAGLIDTPWIALRPLTNIIPAGAAVVLQGKRSEGHGRAVRDHRLSVCTGREGWCGRFLQGRGYYPRRQGLH